MCTGFVYWHWGCLPSTLYPLYPLTCTLDQHHLKFFDFGWLTRMHVPAAASAKQRAIHMQARWRVRCTITVGHAVDTSYCWHCSTLARKSQTTAEGDGGKRGESDVKRGVTSVLNRINRTHPMPVRNGGAFMSRADVRRLKRNRPTAEGVSNNATQRNATAVSRLLTQAACQIA